MSNIQKPMPVNTEKIKKGFLNLLTAIEKGIPKTKTKQGPTI